MAQVRNAAMQQVSLERSDLVDPLEDVGRRWMEAMRAGDFEAAWRQTDRIELRRREAAQRGDATREPGQLLWSGASFEHQRVLVKCEHGLGDTIQFARYFPLLRERAREVTVKVQPALLSLFDGMTGIDRLLNAWTCDPDPPHDVAIECMELAYAFRSSRDTLPRVVPYLPVERIRTQARPLHLERTDDRRVGLVWAASEWDTSRSVPLAELTPFHQVPGIAWFSLQQGKAAAEAGDAPFPLTHLSHLTVDVRDAAYAMLLLDLVITVDTMAAHLAGALGRPVWLLLQHAPDWRWMDAGEGTPWYPTMRLFRQAVPGDWTTPILRMANELAQTRGTL